MNTKPDPVRQGMFLNDEGRRVRTRRTSIVSRHAEVLQDLLWHELVIAAQMTDQFDDVEVFREAITESAFKQPSFQTRHRAAGYFIKWFLPSLNFDDPVPRCWRAFKDPTALEHVMRWQFITSTPLIAGFVDDQLAHAPPGTAIDGLVEAYLVAQVGSVNEKSRARLRSSLRKLGLVMEQKHVHYRIYADVSPRAMALLLAALFAPQPQVVAMDTLVANPWWKRLGIVDEPNLREKLRETAEAGLIARAVRMDTLDQVTTRYSLEQLTAGKGARE